MRRLAEVLRVAALRIRREEPGLRGGDFEWIDAGEQVLAFHRGDGFVNVTNLGPDPVALPPHRALVLTSRPLEDGRLPSDSTAWLAS